MKNVLQRASDEVRNLRADYRLREGLDAFNRCTNHHATATTSISPNTTRNKVGVKFDFALRSIGNNLGARARTRSGSSTGSSNGGVVGLISDLVTVPDPLIAQALSYKRRAALSTVVVDNDDVLFELRRRDLIRGPVNFLPLSTLHLENTSLLPRILSASTMPPRFDMLPVAPESPAPPGFIGYAVRLLQLRPEHEPLRWTVLFTLFKDLVVFETTEQVN